MMKSFMEMCIRDRSKALVVLEDGNKNAELSARNIADVKTAKTNTINVYDILKMCIRDRDETVYVKVDDAGNQKDVTVSDQLKNISSLGTIDDVSDLKDIKNVKGDETFSENNGKLVWQGDKKDKMCIRDRREALKDEEAITIHLLPDIYPMGEERAVCLLYTSRCV